MPTVSDLKDQARAYEQQGHVRKALAVYRHILKHLEDKPALVKVLPLYVKVGDLLLKQNQRSAAVESYEKAAELYAALGSAPRVSALCAKIQRADSRRNDVHVHFTGRLIEAGHVGSARDVLAGYAEAAGLDQAVEALDDLAGRPDDEVKPMLERLLDSVGRGERTSAEEVAKRVSTQLQQVTDVVAGDVVGISTLELSTGSPGKVEEMPDLTPPLIDLGFSTSPIFSPKAPPVDESQRPTPAREPAMAPAPDTAPGPLLRQPASRQESTPLAVPRRRLSETIVAMAKSHRSPLSFALIGFILGAISGAGLMWVFTALLGGSGRATEHTDPTAAVSVSLPAEAADGMPTSSAPTESGPDRVDATAGVPVNAADRSAVPAQESSVPTIEPVESDSSAASAIVVAGLPIRSVTEIEYRGQPGLRVVQPLGPDRVITVESFPTVAAAGPDNLGRVVVNLTPPDTAIGIVRMERHLVYTSALISEDSLRTLMSRLVEREQAN